MITILTGNVLDTLPTLPANSVQCCVTSPPYWGLRDYGTGTWEGGDAACDHVWRDMLVAGMDGSTQNSQREGRQPPPNILYKDTCRKCGARRIDQQLGREPTPEAYVANMVRVFAEVKRVLREDGVLFLNLGDSYVGSNALTTNVKALAGKQGTHRGTHGTIPPRDYGDTGLKPKDLCGIPWRVALALQADGWWLRSDIIWAKPNPMPESVTDRPTKAHEYIFLLTKSARYFYDAEAVKESAEYGRCDWSLDANSMYKASVGALVGNPDRVSRTVKTGEGGTRNKRSVWTITTKPYAEAHFATFPPELPETCILAGTSAHGACPTCGAPWERVVERTNESNWAERKANGAAKGSLTNGYNANHGNGVTHTLPSLQVATLGFAPTCTCGHEDTVPCVVLDPFTGSGTTGAVARTLGRSFIGCELNPEYVKLAEKRIGHAQPALFGI